MPAESIGQVTGHRGAERAVEGDLERVVGGDGDEGRADTHRPAQPTGHERVEGAGIDDPPGHGHVADGEHGEDDGHDDHRRGRAGHSGDRVRGGKHAGADRERSDRAQT